MRYSEISYISNIAVRTSLLKGMQLTQKQLDNLSKYNYTAVKSKGKLLLIFTEKHYLYNISVIIKPFSFKNKYYGLILVVRDFIKKEGLQEGLSL